jgi:hypothetical protein
VLKKDPVALVRFYEKYINILWESKKFEAKEANDDLSLY